MNSPQALNNTAQIAISTMCAIMASSVTPATMATSVQNPTPARRNRYSRRINCTVAPRATA